ncbi:hypothetical protein PsAD26_05140 [Pseudovibrio sp. Ad26]|nr:hypothetical protein PsAD26_05140 [Pseudovibrio sp. Ad26]
MMYSDQYFSSNTGHHKKKKTKRAPEKRYHVLEVFLLFLPFPVLSTLHPELSLWNLSPSPVWIPILIASSILGTRSGILAVLTALAVTLWYIPPQTMGGQGFFEYFTNTGLEPTLWLLTAIIFGEFRTSLLRKNQRLQSQLAHALGQRDTISDYCTTLTLEAENLQSRIASMETTSPVSVCRAIDRLSTLDIQSNTKQLDNILANLIGTTRYSLFKCSNERLGLIHSNITTSSELKPSREQQEQAWLIHHPDTAKPISLANDKRLIRSHTPKGSLVFLFGTPSSSGTQTDTRTPQGAIIFHQLEAHLLEEDSTVLLEAISSAISNSLLHHNTTPAPDNLVAFYSINAPQTSNRFDNSVI